MTFRITYKHFNRIEDYLDTFKTVQDALNFMRIANDNAYKTNEEILDIQPVND